MYETLKIEESEGVLLVTINRPNVANAISTQAGRDLHTVFDGVAQAPEEHRGIVLTGAGERAFCAGADLKERNGLSDGEWHAQRRVFAGMIRAIVECPVPVIAAVNGAAYGGGLELALGCDFIYAARTASLALTEVSLGLIPGAGGTQNLARAVGERRAKELILTASPFSAQTASDWGLVNRLCESGTVVEEALATARRIAANAPISVRQAKRAIHHGLDLSLADGLHFEFEAYTRCLSSQDRREGILAFNEKRKPQFEGR